MFTLSTSHIAEALNQPLKGPKGSLLLTDVVIDSRRVVPNAFFVALPGEARDGHEFIPQAISQGAAAILCREDYKGQLPEHVAVFRVADTQKAFEKIALFWRSRFKIPMLAVVGSVGKTTTKELLAALMRGRYGKVLKTFGSENGELGLPLTLMRLRDEHDCAVIEIGIDAPGMMAKHLKLVGPNAAICTAIAPEHMHLLIDMDTVIKEETLCLEVVAASGHPVALNLDEPAIAPLAQRFKPGVWCGFSLDAKGQASEDVLVGNWSGGDGNLMLSGMGLSSTKIKCPLPGAHNARNLLGAVALARKLGLTREEIERGIASFEPPPGRSQIERLGNGAVVVCDYYNASPASMAAAFQSARDLLKPSTTGGKGRLWLCLADMLELGAGEENYHRDLAPLVCQSSAAGLFYLGERMSWLADAMKSQVFSGEIQAFSDHAELAKYLRRRLGEGDVVLIKGSRGMRMERVWQGLAEP